MTSPRQVLPGQIYLVTRRCTQRQFLLRPDETTNGIFHYALAEAARTVGIEIIAWHAASNHYHAVIHDVRGDLPLFLERFHKLTAKALNRRLRRRENLWAPEQTCAVRLVEESDVLDKVVYTLANPVADGLVDRVFDWPGASALRQIASGRPLKVERPRIFFREGGPMPDTVILAAQPPPAWADRPEAWAQLVVSAVQAKERSVRERRLAEGARIVGRKRILATSAQDRPRSVEPDTELRPSIGCLSRERRARELRALREFRAAYREARGRFAAGHRAVVFPFGTFWLRRSLGVRCAQPEAGWDSQDRTRVPSG